MPSKGRILQVRVRPCSWVKLGQCCARELGKSEDDEPKVREASQQRSFQQAIFRALTLVGART